MSATGSDNVPAPTSGLDRRALIRRAAVLGAAAWTAPVVLDSLASPASALTVNCYLYVFRARRNGNSNNCSNMDLVDTTVCAPTIPDNSACSAYTRVTSLTSPTTVTTPTCTSTGPGAAMTVSFTISSCTIVGKGTSTGTLTTCTNPATIETGSFGTTTTVNTTFNVGQNEYFYAYFLVTC